MSCVIDGIVGKVVDPITDYLYSSIGRQIGYVLKCKENMETLKEKVKQLSGLKDRVEAAVEIARADGMNIKDEAAEWLKEVGESLPPMAEEVGNHKPNLKCLDVSSRYTVGRNCKKMVEEAIKLKEKHGEFGAEVGYRTIPKETGDTSSASYEPFDTRKSLFEDIIKALADDQISKIGIHGMGGVGKTTMVKQVGNEAREHGFDEVAMAVFSQNPDLRKIQGQLADGLNLTLHKESEAGRAVELWNRLKNGGRNGGKVLVILDDVWDDRITLEKIGIPEDNSRGCKVLLTSRSLNACTQMGFENNFPIGFLSKPESWQLFRTTVGDFIESDAEIHSLAQQVCSECGDLPLAICTVGGALSGEQDKIVWSDALEQLKHGQGRKIDTLEEKLYSRIEWSYSYLKQADVRSCFLHCCLFDEDAEISIDVLVWFGVGTKFLESTDRRSLKRARERTHVIVGILKKSSLLLEGCEEDNVKMHDVVRDVAISIASKDPNYLFLVKENVKVWPDIDDYRCCRTISLDTSDRVSRLPDQLDCPELHTFLFLHPSGNSKLQLSSNFFQGMEKLEVLFLANIKVVASSLSHLGSLRMLILIKCEVVNLSFLQELENLEILIIWCEGEAMVLDIARLTHLRLLAGDHLDVIGVSSGCLSDLEEYSIGLGTVKSPEDSFFKKTKKNLAICEIPLRDGIEVLMSKAEELSLESLEGLQKVFDDQWFLDLKYLKVEVCNDLEHLLGRPKWTSQTPLASFGRLTVLEVTSCKSMKYLFSPSTARALPKLKGLLIDNCETLAEIIASEDEVTEKVIFHQLKTMRLWRLPNLISICANKNKTSTTQSNMPCTVKQVLFNDKVMFPVLEKLDIYYLYQIEAIWDKQLLPVLEAGDSFQHLQTLVVGNCERMEEIVAYEVGQGEAEEIIASDDEVTEKVIFHQLKKMRLQSLPNLISICANKSKTSTTQSNMPCTVKQVLFNDKVMFPVLEELEIRGVNQIEAIWDKQLLPVLKAGDFFQHLQTLVVEYCKRVEEIVAYEVGQGETEEIIASDDEVTEKVIFHQLKKMRLQGLPILIIICANKNKTSTTQSNMPCTIKQVLFNDKVMFPVLEELVIRSVNQIEAIWDKQLLQVLEAGDSFQHLQTLVVEKCERMEEIVAYEVGQGEAAEANVENPAFPHLTTMKLFDLPQLLNWGHEEEEEQAAVEEHNKSRLQALVNHKVRFPRLEDLQIRGCE